MNAIQRSAQIAKSLQHLAEQSDEIERILKSAEFPGQYCGRDSSAETGASRRANDASDAAFLSGTKTDHAAAAAAHAAAAVTHKGAGNKGAQDKHQAMADLHSSKAA